MYVLLDCYVEMKKIKNIKKLIFQILNRLVSEF